MAIPTWVSWPVLVSSIAGALPHSAGLIRGVAATSNFSLNHSFMTSAPNNTLSPLALHGLRSTETSHNQDLFDACPSHNGSEILSPDRQSVYQIECYRDRYGPNLGGPIQIPDRNFTGCLSECDKQLECKAVAFDGAGSLAFCYLKAELHEAMPDQNIWGAVRKSLPPSPSLPPSTIQSSSSAVSEPSSILTSSSQMVGVTELPTSSEGPASLPSASSVQAVSSVLPTNTTSRPLSPSQASITTSATGSRRTKMVQTTYWSNSTASSSTVASHNFSLPTTGTSSPIAPVSNSSFKPATNRIISSIFTTSTIYGTASEAPGTGTPVSATQIVPDSTHTEVVGPVDSLGVPLTTAANDNSHPGVTTPTSGTTPLPSSPAAHEATLTIDPSHTPVVRVHETNSEIEKVVVLTTLGLESSDSAPFDTATSTFSTYHTAGTLSEPKDYESIKPTIAPEPVRASTSTSPKETYLTTSPIILKPSSQAENLDLKSPTSSTSSQARFSPKIAALPTTSSRSGSKSAGSSTSNNLTKGLCPITTFVAIVLALL